MPMGFGQWLGLLALLAGLLLLWSLKEVLLVVFSAVVLALALNLPVRVVERRCGWGRPWALLVVLLGLSVVVLVSSVVLVPPFVKEFQELIEKLPQALNTLLALIDDSYRAVVFTIYGDDSGLPDNLTELFRTRTDIGTTLERGLQGFAGPGGKPGRRVADGGAFPGPGGDAGGPAPALPGVGRPPGAQLPTGVACRWCSATAAAPWATGWWGC